MLIAGCFPVIAQAAPGQEGPFAILPGSFHIVPSLLQAGAHEDLTTTFDFGHGENGRTFDDPRETVVNLPAGFTANDTAVPTCSPAQLAVLTGTEELKEDRMSRREPGRYDHAGSHSRLQTGRKRFSRVQHGSHELWCRGRARFQRDRVQSDSVRHVARKRFGFDGGCPGYPRGG